MVASVCEMLLLWSIFLGVLGPAVEGAPLYMAREWDGHEGGVILKSPKDDREYRAITLSNKIRAVLVSDNQTTDSFVHIRVAMGFNGEKVDGLAHFVEHMLFEGSEEFPDANTYLQYLFSKGGDGNAETWTTGTAYYYSIHNEFWIPPARMLASFIGYPSMIPERFDSAIAAVESEYKLSFNSNIEALLAIAFSHSDPESGYKSFNVGSSSTLNISNIHELSLAFHKRYYSGNLMTMVVVSNTSLDSLEGTVREIFSDIPNSDQPRYIDSTFPFSGPSYLNKRVWMKSKDDYVSSLFIGFAVNLPQKEIDLGYLYYITDTKKKGSIYLYLHSRGYITSLSAIQLVDGHVFVIAASLTDKGLANTDFIVKTVITYFKSALKAGVSEDLWKQGIHSAEIQFKVGSPYETGWLPRMILDNIDQGKPTEAYLSAPSTFIFDADKENAILNCITPDNLNIYLVSYKLTEAGSEYGPALTEYEPWYNTSYAFADISAELMDELRNVEEDPELHLPKLNTVIVEDFTMRPIPEDLPKNPVSLPNDDNMIVWWKQETQWLEPNVNIDCRFIPVTQPVSAERYMKSRMLQFMYGAKRTKDEIDLDALSAGYWMELNTYSDEWRFEIQGYSDKKVVKKIISNTFEILNSIDLDQDEDHFNATVRDVIRKEFEDRDAYASISISSMVFELLYSDSSITDDEQLEALEKITQNQLREYRDDFPRSVTVECAVHGNVEQAEALDYVQHIRRELGADEVVKDDGRRAALHTESGSQITLPRGEWLLRARSPDPREVNAATKVMYFLGEIEAGFGGEDSKYMVEVLASILQSLMSHSCFDYLRTVKKLGYSAGCRASGQGSQATFEFYVTGARQDAGPPLMRKEITNLINNEYAKFLQMVNTAEGLAAVEGAKRTVIQRLTDTSDSRSATDTWMDVRGSIFGGPTVDFENERRQQMIDAVKKVTPQLLLEFYKKRFIADQTKVKLSVEVYGANHEMPANTEKCGTELLIQDSVKFRNYLLQLRA